MKVSEEGRTAWTLPVAVFPDPGSFKRARGGKTRQNYLENSKVHGGFPISRHGPRPLREPSFRLGSQGERSNCLPPSWRKAEGPSPDIQAGRARLDAEST